VRLEADGNATVLHYDVRADIGGKLAQLGGSLVQKTAEKLAAEFFQNFEALVAGEAEDSGAASPAEPAAAVPGAPPAGDGFNLWWLAGGVVALAVVAWLAL
jgi:hypothetical protein